MAAINPIRYRGYYYDAELGMYYLQSRYYDPALKRFINADGFVSTGRDFLGYNMFAYCNNNPVNRSDPTGNLPDWVYKYFGTEWNYYLYLYTYGDSYVPYRKPGGGYEKSRDGTKERWYHKDTGLPAVDKHNTDHNNPKQHPDVPHGHTWGWTEDGKWEPGPAYPWPEDNDSTAETMGAILGGALVVYTIIKWGIAIGAAGPTGGASIGAAIVMP